MKKYECEDCRHRFYDPQIVTVQRAGEPSFDLDTCPRCGSEYMFAVYEEE